MAHRHYQDISDNNWKNARGMRKELASVAIAFAVIGVITSSCGYRFSEATAETDILCQVLENQIQEYELAHSGLQSPALIFLYYPDTSVSKAAIKRLGDLKSIRFLPGDSASFYSNVLLPLPPVEGQIWRIRVDWNSRRADVYSVIHQLNVPRNIRSCGNDPRIVGSSRGHTLFRTIWGGWKRENPSRARS